MVICQHAHNGPGRPPRSAKQGFTLIEMIVVMAIVAMLVTLAMPRYVGSLERSRESVLRQDLAVMREAIDRYLGDRGRYPATLDELVAQRYLRRVPVDPYTDSPNSWVLLPPPDGGTGIHDIRSGADGATRAGEALDKL